jgi:hypothetical protein
LGVLPPGARADDVEASTSRISPSPPEPSVKRAIPFFSLTLGTISFEPSLRAEPPPQRPNILRILTDDQRWDTTWAMERVQTDLVADGVNFTRRT